MSPYLPIMPKQIADEAVATSEAGAAVAHIHVRDPQTGRPTPDVNLIKEVVTSIESRWRRLSGLHVNRASIRLPLMKQGRSLVLRESEK